MYVVLYVKYPLLLSDINETGIFLKDFQKICKYKMSNFMKIVQWEPSCSVWTNGHTHRYDKIYVHCLQFCECALKTCHCSGGPAYVKSQFYCTSEGNILESHKTLVPFLFPSSSRCEQVQHFFFPP